MAELKIKAVIGFSGKIVGALNYSPCGNYIVYPLGSFVVLRNLRTEREAFLDGHLSDVSCIAVSNSGRYAASGQINYSAVKVS
jgi:cilia- and flagella-associated protein 52